MRPSGRLANEMRQLKIELLPRSHAEGSCMVYFGNTQVLCNATIEANVPPFLKGKGRGWVTAEYGMLPRATHSRMRREAAQGKQGGRTLEIQRLIARSLRAVTDLEALGERQVVVDCDVIHADGGTRTASITGGFVALYQALNSLPYEGVLDKVPIMTELAAISCGIVDGIPVVDLDYEEDSTAEVDANFVMTSNGSIVEIQGTAEESTFSASQLNAMLELAQKTIAEITATQRKVLKIE